MKKNRYSRPHKVDGKKPAFIYFLWCPLAKRVRYIGKSNQPALRVYLHILAANRGYHDHHTSRWLRVLARHKLEPKIRVVLHVPHGEDWQHYERSLISKAISKGWPLTNQTAGGEGVSFLNDSDFEVAKAARKAGITAEVRSRMSASIKAAWADPEKRQRIVQKQKEAANKSERRKALSRAAHMRTAEGEERRKRALELYWSNPDNKRIQGEATRQRMLAGQAAAMSARRRT